MGIFCKAPFVSQAQWASGNISMCCNDTEYQLTSLEVEWNSESRKKARQQMMNGETPERCKSCINNSSADLVYHYNHMISNSKEELIAMCDPDGYMPSAPSYLHLSPTNKCQLACRMCNQYASSTYDKLYHNIKSDIIFDPKDIELAKPQPIVDYVRKVAYNIQHYVFHGGEPMMSPYFSDIVSSLIEYRDNLRLVILGNGMTINTPHGKKAMELMKQFPSVEFILSIDGVPEVNDYQRCLSDTKLIIENTKLLKQEIPHLDLRINHTLSNISAVRVTEFYDYIQENLPFVVSLHHGYVRYPFEHQVQNLPTFIRERILQELHDYDPAHLIPSLRTAFDELKSVIERDFQLPFDLQMWNRFLLLDNDMNNVHQANGNTFPNTLKLMVPVKYVD